MKLLLLTIFIAWCSASAINPGPFQRTQPDGTKISLRKFGTRLHFGAEVGGYTVLQNQATGFYEYATLKNNMLVSSGLIAGKDSPDGLEKHLRDPAKLQKELEFRTAKRASRMNKLQTAKDDNNRKARTVTPGTVGETSLLLTLIQFKDQKGDSEVSYWENLIFGDGDDRSVTLKSFIYEQSYQQLEIVPARESQGTRNDGVVGWITLDRNHPETDEEIDFTSVIADAIEELDEFVDFSRYDADGNGRVEGHELRMMYVIAGYEGAYGGFETCTPSIWAHMYDQTSRAVFADDVLVIGQYTAFGEKWCEIGEEEDTTEAQIGIIAHEFGHDLGAPDLYDTDGSSAGVGFWGLMGAGNWLDPNQPPSYLAYCKSLFGWLTPIAIESTTTGASLRDTTQTGDVIQIYQNLDGPQFIWWDAQPEGEYFLIEYRRASGYDKALPSCGLLITHIDESEYDNRNDFKPLIKIIEADGDEDLVNAMNDGNSGDVFPGAENVMELGPDTFPDNRPYGSGAFWTLTLRDSKCGGVFKVDIDFLNSAVESGFSIYSNAVDQKITRMESDVQVSWVVKNVKRNYEYGLFPEGRCETSNSCGFGAVPIRTESGTETFRIPARSTGLTSGEYVFRIYDASNGNTLVASTSAFTVRNFQEIEEIEILTDLYSPGMSVRVRWALNPRDDDTVYYMDLIKRRRGKKNKVVARQQIQDGDEGVERFRLPESKGRHYFQIATGDQDDPNRIVYTDTFKMDDPADFSVKILEEGPKYDGRQAVHLRYTIPIGAPQVWVGIFPSDEEDCDDNLCFLDFALIEPKDGLTATWIWFLPVNQDKTTKYEFRIALLVDPFPTQYIGDTFKVRKRVRYYADIADTLFGQLYGAYQGWNEPKYCSNCPQIEEWVNVIPSNREGFDGLVAQNFIFELDDKKILERLEGDKKVPMRLVVNWIPTGYYMKYTWFLQCGEYPYNFIPVLETGYDGAYSFVTDVERVDDIRDCAYEGIGFEGNKATLIAIQLYGQIDETYLPAIAEDPSYAYDFVTLIDYVGIVA